MSENRTTNEPFDVDLALDDYFDGVLDAATRERLQQWLKEGSERADIVAKRSFLHSRLSLIHNRTQSVAEEEPAAATSPAHAAESFRMRCIRFVRRKPVVSSLVAALVLAIVFESLALMRVPSGDLKVGSPLATHSIAARLARTQEAVWGRVDQQGARSPERGMDGSDRDPQSLGTNVDLFVGDRLFLKSGLAEIYFSKGAKVVLEGPAELTIHGGGFCELDVGKLTARVESESARGFIVQTPQATVTDLGTEFGVVAKTSQSTDVHVFQGTVAIAQLTPAGGRSDKLQIHTGQSAKIDSQGAVLIDTANVSRPEFALDVPLEPQRLLLTPVADTRIMAAADDSGHGLSDLLAVYSVNDNVQRTLLAFKLPERRPDLKVERARLILTRPAAGDHAHFDNAEKRPTEIYRLTTAWSEMEASWLKATAEHRWSVPGGDAVGRDGKPLTKPFATSTANPQLGEAMTWDVTDLVAGWYEAVIRTTDCSPRAIRPIDCIFTHANRQPPVRGPGWRSTWYPSTRRGRLSGTLPRTAQVHG